MDTMQMFRGNLVPLVMIILAAFFFLLLSSERHPDPKADENNHRRAMYPDMDKEYIFDRPEGFVFGKQGSRYICHPYVDADGNAVHSGSHVLVIGGSGSGKSSCLAIPLLLNVLGSERYGRKGQEPSVFAIDIKGELREIGAPADRNSIREVSFSDRTLYGYDPLYGLNEFSTEQEVYDWMILVSESLVPIPADASEAFWKTSARQLLTGCLLYLYRTGETEFIEMLTRIMTQPVRELLDEIMEKAQPGSIERNYVSGFSGMSDETLYSVYGELQSSILIFNDPDIRYQMKVNPRKADPSMLEDGCSIFINIPESNLSKYASVLQLIINQTITFLEQRRFGKDGNSSGRHIILLIDELGRISESGRISRLEGALMTLRSRRADLILIAQSLQTLMSAWTRDQIAGMAENCESKIILSASSPESQKEIIAWAGQYRALQKSWNSGKNGSTTTSYEWRDILRPEDLVALPKSGDLILIDSGGYHRLKKVPYYKDPYLRTLAEKNRGDKNKQEKKA